MFSTILRRYARAWALDSSASASACRRRICCCWPWDRWEAGPSFPTSPGWGDEESEDELAAAAPAPGSISMLLLRASEPGGRVRDAWPPAGSRAPVLCLLCPGLGAGTQDVGPSAT